MRYLGLDYGDKTIGVAVSDPEGRIALGVETIRRTNAAAIRASLHRLSELIREYRIEAIVLGDPKNMDGSLSYRSEKTQAFKAKLERYFKRVPVTLWDERLSTVAVLRTKPDGSGNGRAVDEMAAVYILQGFLDSLREERYPMQNDMNDVFAWNEDDDGVITLFDDDGNESSFSVLSSKEHDGSLYLLVAETMEIEDEQIDGTGDDGTDDDETNEENDVDSEADEDTLVEVLHFKCVSNDGDEMAFEIVDDEHPDFALVMTLFKDVYEALEIDVFDEGDGEAADEEADSE